MAKKTNKTDHVLGLLAGKGEEAGTADNKGIDAGNEVNLDGAAGSNVQVVAKQEEDDAIADTVKQLLEEELDEEEGDVSGVMDAIVDKEEEAEAIRAAEEEAERIVEEEARAAEEEKTEMTEEAEKMAEEEAFKKAEEEAIRAAEEEALLEEEEKEEEREYVFLNVMEKLVREKVDTYMERFSTCRCSRCEADTIALALSGLPPKYVVVSRNAAAPLMNFYSQRYAGAITVEITKACTKVNEHPHHGRE